MKPFLTIVFFSAYLGTIFASSCEETIKQQNSEGYYPEYFEFSKNESATMTCVNITSVNDLPLPPLYQHLPQEYEQILNISQSTIVILPKNAFAEFHSISKLYLSGLRILVIHPKAFVNLTQLRELHLDHNRLTQLHGLEFGTLPTLEVLDLSHNLLHTTTSLVFQNLSNLTILNLNGNLMGRLVDRLFENLKSLESLFLSENHLYVFPSHAFVHNGKWALNKLKFADFSKNRMIKCDFDLSHTSLEFLNLSSNRLQDFNFSQIPHDIVSIDLSNNRITTFSNLELLEATDVFLDNNQIRFLNGDVGKSSRLHLSHNQIESLGGAFFNKSDTLRLIRLSYNQISKIDEDVFSDLKHLQELYLDHNQLTETTDGMFNNLKELTILDLSNNKLEELPVGVFKTLSFLKKLDLSGNKLSKLDRQVLHPLSSLTMLHLSSNQMSSVDVEALIVHCPKLETISLDHNPWTCKNLVQTQHTLRKHSINLVKGKSFDAENFHGIKCQNPEEKDLSDSSSVQHLYDQFQEAVNKGIVDSKLHNLDEQVRNSILFHSYNMSSGSGSSEVWAKESTESQTVISIIVNVIQIMLTLLLLCLMVLVFYKLRKGSFTKFASQTQLYYKP